MNLLTDIRASARAICEAHIETTAHALVANQFEEFEQCFALPYEFETFESAHLIKTRAELRETFNRVHRYYLQLGVTRLERRCIEAEFLAEKVMNSTHETRVLRGNELLMEPYPTFGISHFIDGRWRIVKSSYALIDQPAFLRAVTGT